LAKCEKRFLRHREELNGLPMEVADEEVEEAIPLPPELPYPLGSPDSLNKSSDYNSKICFLRYLNLEPISHGKRAGKALFFSQLSNLYQVLIAHYDINF
jgi:hypothetical protein